jgi:hypothetical protein
MKALVLAAALAALSSTALAGAARDAQAQPVVDKTTVTVLADASRLGSASLTSLNGNGSWGAQGRQSEVDFVAVSEQIDTGTLLITLAVLGLLVARPIGRALRRHEQHRRAAALASTLGHSPRG